MASTRSVKGLQPDRVKPTPKPLPASVLGQRTNLMDEPETPEVKPPIPKISPYIHNPYTDQGVIDMKFDFDDVLIMPASQSFVESRYEDVNPYYADKLPIFSAPMDTVINQHNMQDFTQNKINAILPRTVNNKRYSFCFNSLSLDEFEKEITKMSPDDGAWKILIDVANGHMSKVIRYAKLAKQRNPNMVIMAGNIANPDTYLKYCESGAIDYARLGIGNGNGCLTTQQTGVGYPIASLIAECNEIKKEFENPTKMIADGGMKKPSDIIKALALGADYVMIGSMFNKALESAAKSYWYKIPLSKSLAKYLFEHGYNIHKEFRGMSTKKSQRLLGNKTIRTSEGVVKKQIVEYTLPQLIENIEHYLRSAMSYSNSKTLSDFIGRVKFNVITENSFNRYNK